jgi:EAL and modified HD-GYP domain-containing signal transduction protein
MYVLFRQPIYDAEGNVVFYEALLKDIKTKKYPAETDPLKATSISVNLLMELGLEKLTQGKKIFINVPSLFLQASMFELLPPEYVGIELVENKEINNEVLQAVNTLVKRGFSFIIDDFGFEKINYLSLLGKCHGVKIDIKGDIYNDEEMEEILNILRDLDKDTVAKNVETEEDFLRAKGFGFKYFQGFYLGKPEPIRDVKSFYFMKRTIIELYKALRNRNLKRAAQVIESDVGATYRLLSFVRENYKEANHIDSVEAAVSFLNVNKMANFALSLAITELFAGIEEEEFIRMSLFRASLAEELTKIFAPDKSEKAYLMGLFSTTKLLMNEAPEDVARELNLDKEIIVAYERRNNELGLVLSLVELLEDRQDKRILDRVAKILRVDPADIKKAIRKARNTTNRLFNLKGHSVA